ncbi:MAG: T9SS type A sorting domain-containing protein [Chitinispirillaceae bacterium]
MKSFHNSAILAVCLFVYGLSANPRPPINTVSEVQVIDPSHWSIEILLVEELATWAGSEPNSNNFFHIGLISDRYTDTTIVTSSSFADNRFVFISDSIKPPEVFEIQRGDLLKVMLLDQGLFEIDSIDVLFSEDIMIDYVGSDSSMCLCGDNSYRVSGTPTIGASNIFDSNEKILYVLSSEDSLPVTGLGLYIPKYGYGICDSLYQEISEQGTVSFSVGPCQSNTFAINDRASCFDNPVMETVTYEYQEGALPQTDTVYLTTSAAVVSDHTEQNYEKLHIMNTPTHSIIIVNSSSNTYGPAECRIYNASGQMVKKLTTTMKGPGTYSISWDRADSRGKDVGAGTYFMRFKGKNISFAKRFILQ